MSATTDADFANIRDVLSEALACDALDRLETRIAELERERGEQAAEIETLAGGYCMVEARAERYEKALRALRNEVDCRIGHGADSNGHLEYVVGRFDYALAEQPPTENSDFEWKMQEC